MTEAENLPMFVGELFYDRSECIPKILFIVCIMGFGQSTKSRYFGFHAGFLYIQLCKSQSSPAAETPPLIAASIDRNTAEPGIKWPVDVKGLQREIDFAQNELKDIVGVRCRTGMPANET